MDTAAKTLHRGRMRRNFFRSNFSLFRRSTTIYFYLFEFYADYVLFFSSSRHIIAITKRNGDFYFALRAPPFVPR